MKQQRSTKWNDWRTKVARRCNELARQWGGGGTAIALRDIALSQRISQVQFRPLLVEGGLGRRGNGFVVFVKCASENIQEYSKLFYDNGGIGLPTRSRFTIAHEIVHTLFFDLSQKTPETFIKATHHMELESLESACNFGASEMLLPTYRVEQVLETSDQLRPDTIISLANAFGVSIDVLLIRLSRLKMWGPNNGAVAIVNTFGKKQTIELFASDRHSEPLFPNAKAKADADTILRDERMKIFGGNESTIEAEILCQNGFRQTVIAGCAPINAQETRYLYSVRLLGKTRSGISTK